jgi:hypothetical protein
MVALAAVRLARGRLALAVLGFTALATAALAVETLRGGGRYQGAAGHRMERAALDGPAGRHRRSGPAEDAAIGEVGRPRIVLGLEIVERVERVER